MTLHRTIAAALILATAAGTAFAASPVTDWASYGNGPRRDGNNPRETTIGPANVGKLKSAWLFDALAYDRQRQPTLPWGASVFVAQPVVASGVKVGGTTKNLVLIGDNSGTFFALDADSTSRTGTVVWARSLGWRQTNCHDLPNGQFGIVSTATFDRAANGGKGAVYVAENAKVWAFDLATGADLPGWPIAIPDITSATDGIVYGGLTLRDGQLYVPTGSTCDYIPYRGQIALIDTARPAFVRHWWTVGGGQAKPAQQGGAIWGTGGITYDPTDRVPGVYAATGNSLPDGSHTSEQQPYAEAIVKISPDLTKVIDHVTHPWVGLSDTDLSSAAVLFKPAACRTSLVAAASKYGYVIGYPSDDFHATPDFALHVNTSAGILVDDVAWDDAHQVLVSVVPGARALPYNPGLAAWTFDASCQPKEAWNVSRDLSGKPIANAGELLSSPSIANGVVYFGTGGFYEQVAGTTRVIAVNEVAHDGVPAGKVLWQSNDIAGPALTAPTVVNGKLLVGAFDSALHAYDLPASR